MILHEVERAKRGSPLLQFAMDGWWERASRLVLPATCSDIDQMLDRLGRSRLGVEVVWPGPPVVFVGARIAGCAQALHRIAAQPDLTAAEAFTSLAGARPEPPVHAEIGVFNAWRSVAPLRLRLDDRSEVVEAALASRPDLTRCRHPVALEVAYRHHREAWWGIEVSVPNANSHRVEVERVVTLLRSVTLEARTPR